MNTKPFCKTPIFLALTLAMGVSLSSCAPSSHPYDAARSILIQHNGQIKSFEAYSRQTISLITEKESWKKEPPALTLLEALSDPDSIKDIPWISIRYKELVSYLGLPGAGRHFFSYNDVTPSLNRLEVLVRNAQMKRNQDIRPSLLEQKAEALYAAVFEVRGLLLGETLKVIPSEEGGEWLSPYQVSSSQSNQFKELLQFFKDKRYADFENRVNEWKEEVHEFTGRRYETKVELEVIYFGVRPFQCAWILYLSAFLILSVLPSWKGSRGLGFVTLALAVLSHTLGLVLRILILSRPPVSNMYESMIFMNWVLMVFAVIFSVVRKNPTPASVGSLISAVILIYGNLLPIDSGLGVLVPVLRSNYWLSVHVLTIVASYGIFALAMGLGHRHLILDLRGRLNPNEEEKSAITLLRVIQIGLLFLGIGTVLGGVWANESWGRFWGWDPKETWALITFLGYLIIVHLQLTKVLSPFVLAVSSILAFQFVLMTWYGVNFVLGRGLHSYGQGSGGIVWVIVYLALEALFVLVVLIRKLSAKA